MPGAMPPCGRRAVLEGLQHVPKALPGDLRLETDQGKDFLLKIAVVDPDRAAADLVAVEHHIVLLPAGFAGSLSSRWTSSGIGAVNR